MSIALLGFRTMLRTFDFRDGVRSLLHSLSNILFKAHNACILLIVVTLDTSSLQLDTMDIMRCHGLCSGHHGHMAGEFGLCPNELAH